MNTMVVGVDASLSCTGIVVGDSPQSFIASAVKIKPMGKDMRNKFIRLKTIVNWVMEHLKDVQEPIIFIEGYGFASQSAVAQAELGGMLRVGLLSVLGEHGRLIEVPPTSIKLFVAEHGHAKKPMIAEWVKKRWDVAFKTDDECDAYGIWRFGRAYLGIDTGLSAKQAESVDKVKNPKCKVRKIKKTA